MSMMPILSEHAIQYLNRELCLPQTGREQDWEIELADPARLDEFIEFYSTSQLDDDTRAALMALIISSVEDHISDGNIGSDLWGKIRNQLFKDIDLHKELIEYWSVSEATNDDDMFGVTELMRSIQL